QSPLSHAERLLPRVLTSDDLEPALAPHPLDVAAERGGVDLQNLAHVSRPCDAELGGGDEDVDLADLHPEPAQRLVVELGHDAVEQPQTHRETFAGDIVDGRADLGHTIYLYIQVNGPSSSSSFGQHEANAHDAAPSQRAALAHPVPSSLSRR